MLIVYAVICITHLNNRTVLMSSLSAPLHVVGMRAFKRIVYTFTKSHVYSNKTKLNAKMN